MKYLISFVLGAAVATGFFLYGPQRVINDAKRGTNYVAGQLESKTRVPTAQEENDAGFSSGTSEENR